MSEHMLLNPGDVGFNEVSRQVTEKTQAMRRRINWKEVRKLYDDLEVGGSVLLDSGQVTRVSNICVVMSRRGLKRTVDYEVSRVITGAKSLKKVAITRLSNKTA